MSKFTFVLSGRAVIAIGASILVLGTGAGWLLKSTGNAPPATRTAETTVARAPWRAATSPLSTRFAKDVSPDKVRPEYPRPQFVRPNWLSLNGLWEFGFDNDNVGEKEGWHTGTTFAQQILVPFTFESSLSGIGLSNEVHEHVWYRRSFKTPSDWKGQRILLHFGAVDWETKVWVNGQEVGKHRGGYTPFTLDITDAIRGGDSQELVVHAYDPSEKSPSGWQPRGKQQGSGGIMYTRTTGIWQSVWLEPVPKAHLSDVTMTPSFDANGTGKLLLSATLPKSAAGMTVEASISDNSQQVATQQATVSSDGSVSLTVIVPQAKPWTPETPQLYDLTLRLISGGRAVDMVTSYTAFRSVGIANGRLTLNGKPYFYRGVLDQGYWPDGIYTPPTEDAIKADVEAVKNLGFNMARKHIKVEDARWYYWCDRLGVAVWQDMPSSINLSTLESKEEFRKELPEVMAATRNYPSVVHWIPFNENWGNPGEFQDEIVELTRRIDPSRPITDASGWTQRSLTDVIDAHNYSDSLAHEGTSNPVKPKVVGEYGGVGLSVPGHIWAEGRIYVHANNVDEMLRLLRARTSDLYDAPNLSGFVYTQLADVEQELNGLLTYDREPKADAKAIAAIMQGKNRAPALPGFPLRDWLVLGPIPSGNSVNATDANPEALARMGKVLDTPYLEKEGQIQPTDGQTATVPTGNLVWKKMMGPLIDFQQTFPGSPHNDAVVYAVSYVNSPRDIKGATLYLGSDDGAVVWLNGKQVYRKVAIRGVTVREDKVPGLVLKKGRNVLVIKVGQGQGGWGLSTHLQLP